LSRRFGLHVLAGSHPIFEGRKLHNTALLFLPDGSHVAQRKLHITPSERASWKISGGDALRVIATPKANIGILICYDVEFPEAARHLADAGADILFVPFCTDNRSAYLRVRYCAQARAVENQFYVVTAGLVGNLPNVPEMDIHYGQAAVFTPSDFAFARDGILAEADPNIETLLIADLDLSLLHHARQAGSVTPRRDRRHDLFPFQHRLRRSTR
jgi:predicted amidohydrolase